VILSVILGSTTFSLLGVIVSLLMHEVFEAMTLSNYVRFPMVFLCGVFVPLTAMPPALRIVAFALPLTYTVDALRHLLLRGQGAYFHLAWDLAISALLAVILYVAALKLTVYRLEDLL
jgi:ABC-2 type transport system permease protein